MNDETTALKRSINLPLLTFYGLGTILGAGIYVLIGEVVAVAGLFTPLSFLVAAVMVVFTAFSYAELSSRFPRSAGEAVYIQEAFGIRGLSLLIGGMVILIGIISSATILNGFVGYAQLLLAWPDEFLLFGITLILALIAIWGISESIWMASIVTIIEMIGLLIIIAVAGDSLGDLPQRLPELVPGTGGAWLGVMLGAFIAFYAFIGFEDMVNVAEEVKQPQKTLPKAIILALIFSTLFYGLVALVAVLSVPVAELAGRKAPLSWIYQQATGNSPLLITYISMFAIINGALIQIIMGSRVLYGLANQGWLPDLIGKIHPYTRTPVVATVMVATAILIFAIWLPLLTLAQITSFITLLVFTLVNLSLIIIKLRGHEHDGAVSYPLPIPVLGLLISLAFVFLHMDSL